MREILPLIVESRSSSRAKASAVRNRAGHSGLPVPNPRCLLFAAREEMSDPRAETREQRQPGKHLIYVVDDEAMLLELACVILEPLGYDVQTFRDPEAALRNFTAARPRPSLLITDYAMHHMNGMALIEACRRVEPKQKILLVSGTVGPDVFHSVPNKPDQFLAKPYHARQLIGLVRSMLDR